MKLIHRINRRPVVAAVLVAGLLATMSGALVANRSARVDAERWLEKHADVVREGTQQTVSEVIEDLEAVSAFLETARDAGEVGFTEFVSRIDGSVSQVGVAYSVVVPPDEHAGFLEEARETDPDYRITTFDETGEVVPVPPDGETVVYPIKYFAAGSFLELALQAASIPEAPTLLATGIDAGSTSDWLPSLETSVSQDTAVASDFMDISYSGFSVPNVFFVSVPVHDEAGDVIGVVAAPMLDVLLTLAGYTSSEVEWELAPLDSTTGFESEELLWMGTVDLPGVTWQLAVRPSAAKAAALLAVPTRLIVLTGLALTALVTGLVHLALERRAARRRFESLQKLSEDKDRFLAAVSHEIRTPLTTVHGLTHELAERPDDFSVEEAASLLELVVEQADEVAAIVEDLLVAARTDIGRVSIYPADINLGTEVDEVLAGTATEAAILGNPGPAWADGRRVRQILRNLLTNAGRYGGSRLEVRFAGDAAWSTVTVADDGPAISVSHQERIFDPYTSAHENNKQVGSVGLGLFISRKLARVMGGELEYRHDGEFSCFTLRLPRVEAAELRAVG
ncbi:MAG: HAMP domain-containing histidine kinase [Acidimicrobiia bacterium]|nr:HAMP domain-containing histidine kinase [Acidimicrobiia bacterium]